MRNLKHLLPVILIVIISSCKSTQNTFTTVYEKKLDAKPDYYLSFQEDGEAIFGIEGKKSDEGYEASKAFYVSGDGENMWSKKITRLGQIQKDPNFMVLWEEGVALFFSRTLFNFNLSCIDLASQKELWKIEDGNPGKYNYSAVYIPSVNGLLHYTPDGLKMYNVQTGETAWTREDLAEETKFSDFFVENSNSGFFYSEVMDKIFISHENTLHAMNPNTGKYDWTIDKPIGMILNADIFEEDGVAFFYGVEDKSLAEAIVRSSDARVDQVMNVMESGLAEKELYFVDLENGNVLWEQNYKSNGIDEHLLVDDKVIVSNIITYVFDRNTGEVKWQSVEEDRLETEDLLKAIKAVNLIDLTVGDKDKPSDMVSENAVYNIYPTMFENPLKKNQVSLRKYDLETGDVMWKTEDEKITPGYFYGVQDKIFLVGRSRLSSKILVYDEKTGSKQYELSFNEHIRDIVPTDQLLYVTYGYPIPMMKVFDKETGVEQEMSLVYGAPSSIRDVGNYIMAAYDKSNFKETDKIAFHQKSTWDVVKEIDVPEYFDNFTYKGNNLFLTDFNSRERGIIDIDLENLTVHDFLITRTSGSFTVNGQDQLLGTYNLFITSDGKYIYETDGKTLRKLEIN